jgi:hypothetical protein
MSLQGLFDEVEKEIEVDKKREDDRKKELVKSIIRDKKEEIEEQKLLIEAVEQDLSRYRDELDKLLEMSVDEVVDMAQLMTGECRTHARYNGSTELKYITSGYTGSLVDEGTEQ